MMITPSGLDTVEIGETVFERDPVKMTLRLSTLGGKTMDQIKWDIAQIIPAYIKTTDPGFGLLCHALEAYIEDLFKC